MRPEHELSTQDISGTSTPSAGKSSPVPRKEYFAQFREVYFAGDTRDRAEAKYVNHKREP
jgi:hypothetical protein